MFMPQSCITCDVLVIYNPLRTLSQKLFIEYHKIHTAYTIQSLSKQMRTYYAYCPGEQFQSASPLLSLISGCLQHCAEADPTITPECSRNTIAISNMFQEQGEERGGKWAIHLTTSKLKLIVFPAATHHCGKSRLLIYVKMERKLWFDDRQHQVILQSSMLLLIFLLVCLTINPTSAACFQRWT